MYIMVKYMFKVYSEIKFDVDKVRNVRGWDVMLIVILMWVWCGLWCVMRYGWWLNSNSSLLRVVVKDW